MGSVAAAPAQKSDSKPAPKPTAKANSKKDAEPKLSKWQMHVQEMLKVSAPGDEYFGRMKMSYLGINNTFRDDLHSRRRIHDRSKNHLAHQLRR